MFTLPPRDSVSDTAEWYDLVYETIDTIIGDETDLIANMANVASVLHHTVNNINWVGFYLLKENTLVLGPFFGLPACIRIDVGSGVCGTAAAEGRTVIVDDVDLFPSHIACDAASQSEIVVPLLAEGRVIGVLDVDSPVRARFSDLERSLFEKIARRIS